jgi:hypothetical protein
MNVLDTGNRGWFGKCVALLQAGQPIELHVRGRHARRFARAVSLGADYRPNFLALWLMPRLNVVLEAAMQNRYRVQANATENKGVLAFVFTREESGRSPSSN